MRPRAAGRWSAAALGCALILAPACSSIDIEPAARSAPVAGPSAFPVPPPVAPAGSQAPAVPKGPPVAPAEPEPRILIFGDGEAQRSTITPVRTEQDERLSWAVVVGIAVVSEVAVLWLAASLGLWRRRLIRVRAARIR
jgi:hypothetical protein